MSAAALRCAHSLLLVLLLASGSLIAPAVRAEIAVTDAAGRQVRLEAPARRIVTNESLLLLSLALVAPDPVALIAGWAAPQRIDRGIYAAFRQRFPGIDKIPAVGTVVPANASVEGILSARPDLFVVSLWHPGWEPIAERLQAAGVPVIFLDGPQDATRNPAEASAVSVELLGAVTGHPEKAAAFAAFVRERYKSVAARLARAAARPAVLIDAFAGIECCSTPGAANRLTQLVELAGGRNIGAQVVAGYDGRLSPEYVLGADPQVYIGTGGLQFITQNGLVLGAGVDLEVARASLRSVLSHGVRRGIGAAREGRAFGISHQLAISTLSILTLECFARWTNPDLFADLDPARTLAEINRRFLAVPLDGTFWTSLTDEAGGTRR